MAFWGVGIGGLMRNVIWRAFTGELLDTTNHKDKLVATLGALCAIYGVILVSGEWITGPAQGLVVASMGASAVLLFAVPHGALSQPWPLVGGHVTGALVGVTSSLLIPDTAVAAAVAVAISITLMHYLRCIHPPAGATALFAVMGGSSIHALGYGFLLHPVLSNVAVMLAVALVFNYPFPWRRYPAGWHRVAEPQSRIEDGADDLDNEDLEYAMREMNLHMDITEEDLARLYHLAKQHHSTHPGVDEDAVEAGACYSNGRIGAEWSVRKVLAPPEAHADGAVAYRVVAGEGVGEAGNCTRREFARWAGYRIKTSRRCGGRMFEPSEVRAGAA